MSEATESGWCPDCKGTGMKQPRDQITPMCVIRDIEIKTGAAGDRESG